MTEYFPQGKEVTADDLLVAYGEGAVNFFELEWGLRSIEDAPQNATGAVVEGGENA